MGPERLPPCPCSLYTKVTAWSMSATIQVNPSSMSSGWNLVSDLGVHHPCTAWLGESSFPIADWVDVQQCVYTHTKLRTNQSSRPCTFYSASECVDTAANIKWIYYIMIWASFQWLVFKQLGWMQGALLQVLQQPHQLRGKRRTRNPQRK